MEKFVRWLVFFWTVAAWAQGGPPGARVTDLFADPSTQGLVFAATSRGVFRTENGGLSWGPASAGLTSASVSAITGSGQQWFAATTEAGVFRSADQGDSWTQASNGLTTLDVRSLAIDPADPDTIYAGTRFGGIFKTTDGGNQWTAINIGLLIFNDTIFEGDYLDILVDPNNSQIVYAMQTSLTLPGDGFLFKSTNGGAQWTAAGSGAPGQTLAIHPSDSNVIYLGTGNGLSISTDAGQSAAIVADLFGFSITDIVIDPGDPSLVYISTQLGFTFRSTDAGQTWEGISEGMPFGEVFALVIDPNETSTVFAGFNGTGVFRSTDGGDHWQIFSDGLATASIRALAVDPQNNANVLADVFGGGLFLSTAAGDRWEESREGLLAVDLRSIAFDPQNTQNVYAGSVNPFTRGDGGFFKSTDGGRNWNPLFTGASVFRIVIDPANPAVVYVATAGGVFKSQDGGVSFTSINDIQGTGVVGALTAWNITGLAMDPSDSQRLYAAGSITDFFGQPTFQLFSSDDGGDVWDPMGPTLTSLLDVVVDPSNTKRLFVSSAFGVFRSEDRGRDGFVPVVSGAPGGAALSVTSMVADPQDNGAIYIATNLGVFKSTDGGNNWDAIPTGIETQIPLVLSADPVTARTLYLGTFDGGVFKTTDGGALWTPTRAWITSLPVISRSGIVNAADFSGQAVTPGELVSIFGLNIGPAQGVTASFDPQTGKLPTLLGGVRVFFNNFPAPLLFTSEGQINAQVPFEVAGVENVVVRVEIGGQSSNTSTITVADAHPGLFNIVANLDGTINSAENPAAAGGFVILYATGQGLLDKPLMTGSPAPLPTEGGLFTPLLPVSLLVGDTPPPFSAAVLAPQFVGLIQINLMLPAGLAAGEYEVFLRIGEHGSPVPVLVYVQ